MISFKYKNPFLDSSKIPGNICPPLSLPQKNSSQFSSVILEQRITKSSPLCIFEQECMYPTAVSLPLPVSPVINILLFLSAN